MCSRNLFNKVAPGEKEQTFYQNSSPAASELWRVRRAEVRIESLFFMFFYIYCPHNKMEY